MKIQLKLLLFFSLLLVSCEKDDATKILDLEQFSIEVPSTWKSSSSQGYDSKTGKLTNGKVELSYDYGWYSYNFRNEGSETHSRISTTIDGKSALIVKPIEKGKGVFGVYIDVNGQVKLSIYGQDIKDESTVLKIFESVRF